VAATATEAVLHHLGCKDQRRTLINWVTVRRRRVTLDVSGRL